MAPLFSGQQHLTTALRSPGKPGEHQQETNGDSPASLKRSDGLCFLTMAGEQRLTDEPAAKKPYGKERERPEDGTGDGGTAARQAPVFALRPVTSPGDGLLL
ncbi:MAG: hypothetical protein JWO67_4330, partial [Streptosporangiaceae bacterium]|nr:hypothetical protein [Streptosporangiaceae bacterium]